MDISLKIILILLILLKCIAVIMSFFCIDSFEESNILLIAFSVLFQAMLSISIGAYVYIYAFLIWLITELTEFIRLLIIKDITFDKTDILIFLKMGLQSLIIVGGLAQIYFILFKL